LTVIAVLILTQGEEVREQLGGHLAASQAQPTTPRGEQWLLLTLPLLVWASWAAALLAASVERTTMALQITKEGDLGVVLSFRLPEAAWTAQISGHPLHTTAAFLG